MKNDKNTITWMAGSNVCEFDTATWYTKVHPMPVESFAYASYSSIPGKSRLIQYSQEGATDCSGFAGNAISLKGSMTGPYASFRKRGNYTITLLQRNHFRYSGSLANIFPSEAETQASDRDMLSNQGGFCGDPEKGASANLKSIHDNFYNNWVDRIYEFFELDDSWEGTFRKQSEFKHDYTYTVDFAGSF